MRQEHKEQLENEYNSEHNYELDDAVASSFLRYLVPFISPEEEYENPDWNTRSRIFVHERQKDSYNVSLCKVLWFVRDWFVSMSW